MKQFTRFWAAMMLAAALFACYGLDDDYNVAPGLRLGFSTDTLAFDTVLTTVGSATHWLMVYNRNDAPLLIESIKLVGGASTTGFRINVDGRNGNTFSDIRIEANDSLYIFVEITSKPNGTNVPALVEDWIEFSVNGTMQRVVLQAWGQDTHTLRGGCFISRDTLWDATKPYLIYDSIVVDSGARLTIEAGAILYMHDRAKWVINGTLEAVGTVEQPIVFRGDRLDFVNSDLPFDLISGLWDGMYFQPGSYGNELSHTVVRNAFRGVVCTEAEMLDKVKIRISDSQIKNMSQSGMEAVNSRIKAVNTEFANAAGAVVSVTGGSVEFMHCTLANFYRIKHGRMGQPTLFLSNYTEPEKGEKKSFPLHGAIFVNCIIDGSYYEGSQPYTGELGVARMDESDFNMAFRNCAIKTAEIEDSNFVAIRYISSSFAPVYKKISDGNSSESLVYDFRPLINKDNDGKPEKKQPVVGQADTAVARLYPVDRLGVPRLENKTDCDIGAYEHVEEDNEEGEMGN
ncbi:MAG: hypothetical protein LBH04_01530 [Tannerellaceae bacterium]|nr:hypothetical protein [Tannerellaceae bacterium]